MLSTGAIVLIVTNSTLDDGDELDEAMGDLALVTKRPLLYQMNVFAISLSSSLLSFSSETNYLFLHQNLNVGCLNPKYFWIFGLPNTGKNKVF